MEKPNFDFGNFDYDYYAELRPYLEFHSFYRAGDKDYLAVFRDTKFGGFDVMSSGMGGGGKVESDILCDLYWHSLDRPNIKLVFGKPIQDVLYVKASSKTPFSAADDRITHNTPETIAKAGVYKIEVDTSKGRLGPLFDRLVSEAVEKASTGKPLHEAYERTLNWKAKEEYAKKLTVEELNYAIKDCIEAGKALPENSGYYHDEASVYRKELDKRMKKTKKISEAKEEWSKCDACGEVFPTSQVIDATGHPACPKCGVTDTISKSGKPKTIREAIENDSKKIYVLYGKDDKFSAILRCSDDYESIENTFNEVSHNHDNIIIDTCEKDFDTEAEALSYIRKGYGIETPTKIVDWDLSLESLIKILTEAGVISNNTGSDKDVAVLNGKKWVRTIVKNPRDGADDVLWFSRMDDGTHVMMFHDLYDVGAAEALEKTWPQPYHVGEFVNNEPLYRALVDWLRKKHDDSDIAGKTF